MADYGTQTLLKTEHYSPPKVCGSNSPIRLIVDRYISVRGGVSSDCYPTNKINNANNITEEYFINQVNKIIESNELKYDQVMIKDFCSYWTEKNIGGFKMRFQKQNTFDINRRLKRWYSNAKDWDHKQKKLSKNS